MARGNKGGGGPRAKPRGSVHGGQGSLRDLFVPSVGNGIRSDLPRRRTSAPGSHHGELLWLGTTARAPANMVTVDLEQSYPSLRDEARNTERHYFWKSDMELRHSQVSFVSGGDLDARRLTETCRKQGEDVILMKDHTSGPSVHPESAFAGMNLHEEECIIHEGSANSQLKVDLSDPENDKMLAATVLPAASEHGFIVDTVGSSTTIKTGLPPPVIRSYSPSSDSSDEVIVFAGRNQVWVRKASRSTPRAEGNPGQGPQETAFVNTRSVGGDELNGTSISDVQKSNSTASGMIDRLVSQENHINPSLLAPYAARSATLSEHPAEEKTSSTESITHREWREQRTKGGRRKKGKKKTTMTTKRTTAKQVDEAILADYIANMSDDVDFNGRLASTPFNGRAIGGTDTDGWRDETDSSSSERQPKTKSGMGSGWHHSDIDDLNDLSTSDEVLGKVQAVLSKRERPSGLQYLIVWEGYTVDDARWVPYASLGGESAFEQIRLFEEEEEFVKQYSADGGDKNVFLDEDQAQDSGTDDEAETLKDEEDLFRRRISRMTDEKVARLLAKQEEMGMGSDELMLFDDGDVDDCDDSVAIEIEHVPSITQVLRPIHSWNRGSKRPKSEYPPASAFADLLDQDPYNGFDIMDHDRPSLRKKPKGRQGRQTFDLSDSDLELSLSITWDDDRTKKKARKQEREELRAQGLLGKKNKNKADLKGKYLEGMTMDQVKDEIKDFLLSNSERYHAPVYDMTVYVLG